MPQSSDDGSKGLLPLIIELQAKLNAIEGQCYCQQNSYNVYSVGDLKRQPVLPGNVMENINSMQSTVEQLLADMSLVSNCVHVILLM